MFKYGFFLVCLSSHSTIFHSYGNVFKYEYRHQQLIGVYVLRTSLRVSIATGLSTIPYISVCKVIVVELINNALTFDRSTNHFNLGQGKKCKFIFHPLSLRKVLKFQNTDMGQNVIMIRKRNGQFVFKENSNRKGRESLSIFLWFTICGV